MGWLGLGVGSFFCFCWCFWVVCGGFVWVGCFVGFLGGYWSFISDVGVWVCWWWSCLVVGGWIVGGVGLVSGCCDGWCFRFGCLVCGCWGCIVLLGFCGWCGSWFCCGLLWLVGCFFGCCWECWIVLGCELFWVRGIVGWSFCFWSFLWWILVWLVSCCWWYLGISGGFCW